MNLGKNTKDLSLLLRVLVDQDPAAQTVSACLEISGQSNSALRPGGEGALQAESTRAHP